MLDIQSEIGSCKKDQGYLTLEKDGFGWYVRCMQCGTYYEVKEITSGNGHLSRKNQSNRRLSLIVNGLTENSTGNEIFDNLIKVADTINSNFNPVMDIDIQLQTQIKLDYVRDSLNILNPGGYVTRKNGGKGTGITYETEPQQSENITKIVKEHSNAIAQYFDHTENGENSKNGELFDSEDNLTEFGQYVQNDLDGNYSVLQELIQTATKSIESKRKN